MLRGPCSTVAGMSGMSLLQGALWTAARRVLNFGSYSDSIARAAAIAPGDRVVDVGCGTGEMTPIVPVGSPYLGIDLSEENLAQARRWHSAAGREFRQLDVTRESLPGGPFDIALMVAILHHMDDATTAAVLTQLAPQVRKRIIVADLLSVQGNPMQRLWASLDQGKFVRTLWEQKTLIERYVRVVSGDVFATRSGSATLTLFVCEPKERAG